MAVFRAPAAGQLYDPEERDWYTVKEQFYDEYLPDSRIQVQHVKKLQLV